MAGQAFAIDGLARDPEAAGGLFSIALDLAQDQQNVAPFHLGQALAAPVVIAVTGNALDILRKTAEDHRSFDEVAKYPDVSRPIIACERSAYPVVDGDRGHAELLGEFAHEQGRKFLHIVAAILQQRQMDLHDIDTEEEIGTKTAGLDALGKIGIGGKDEAGVEGNLAFRADRPDTPAPCPPR